jgi:IclR family transcriptional regulator, acetate operon repressor
MQRVVAILESVSQATTPATPARVAEETALSLSTVSRIMRELADEDLLEKADDGTYQLGARVFSLVTSAAMQGDQAAAVNRVLQDLRDLTGETASLHVRRGDQRVCVASATSRHQLRRVIPIGDAVGLVGTVPGDIFLAGEAEAERDALVSAVLSASARRAQLEKIQFATDHGYSVSSVDSIGLTGIAVPVRIAGETPAALALSGPTMRFSAEIAESWLHDLQKAAKRLEPRMETIS